MKKCSLNDFMTEMKPWLDSNHIKKACLDENGHFVLHFMDGMRNVYAIDDCNKAQVDKIFKELQGKGIPTEA